MEEIRPIEILLSERQFQEFVQAVTPKRWLRSKDLPGYLNMADSTRRAILPNLPYHLAQGTKLYDPNEIDDYIKDL